MENNDEIDEIRTDLPSKLEMRAIREAWNVPRDRIGKIMAGLIDMADPESEKADQVTPSLRLKAIRVLASIVRPDPKSQINLQVNVGARDDLSSQESRDIVDGLLKASMQDDSRDNGK